MKPGYGILRSTNPEWPQSEVKLSDLNIVGKVISVIKNYN